MRDYFIRRMLLIPPTLFGISVLVFTITRLAPGGPLEQAMMQMQQVSQDGGGGQGIGSDQSLSQDQMEQMKRLYGFDKPHWEAYLIWLGVLPRETEFRQIRFSNFEYQISLDVKQFQNRHELGIYLHEVFQKVPTFKLVNNYKLWDWISLQYFDLIFTEKGTASDWRFRLIDDHKLKFRNLMYVPWWLLRHYGEEDSRIFLTRLNYDTGLKSKSGDKNIIIEALKKKDIKEYESLNEYKNLLKVLPDIELIDIKKKDD